MANRVEVNQHLFNIRYFMMNDFIGRKELNSEYCPTGAIMVDFMTCSLFELKWCV